MDGNELQGGGTEVQIEPVDPVPGPLKEVVVQEPDPVVCRSTKIARPSTRYSVAELDLT